MRNWKVMSLLLSASLLVGVCGCEKQKDAAANPAGGASASPKNKTRRGKGGSEATRAQLATAAAAESALETKRKRSKQIDWPQAGPDAPNILIITIDTLRASHVGCYGYFRNTSPNIDAFSEECLFFENCLAPVAQTLPTHTSLFTAVYPREHGITANLSFTEGLYQPSPYLHTFADVLSRCGYTTAAFVSAEPVKKETGLAVGFQIWHEPEDGESHTARAKVIAPVTLKKVYTWLEAGVAEPFMCWIHIFDPHASYAPPPPYDTMFKTDEALEAYMAKRRIADSASKERREGLSPKVWDSRDSINGYDGEIAFTDYHIGKLFAKLRDVGLWDKTSIVLLSDHGEGLGQHAYPEHGEIWQEQVHVPLLMRIPGKTPRRISTRMSVVDVIPTLLGALGDVPWGDIFLEQSTGSNVLAGDYKPGALYTQHPRTRPGIFANSIIVDGWKYIMYDPNGPKHRRKDNRLFNLEEDPFELNDLVDTYPDKAAALKKRLEGMIAEQNSRGRVWEVGKTKAISEQKKNALRDLGYLDDEEDE